MKKSKSTEAESVGRRDFLKLAGTAAPAAVVAASVGTEAAASADAPQKSGLQDNAHTRTYYDLARF